MYYFWILSNKLDLNQETCFTITNEMFWYKTKRFLYFCSIPYSYVHNLRLLFKPVHYHLMLYNFVYSHNFFIDFHLRFALKLWTGMIAAGNTKREVSQYRWPPVWLVWNQLYDNWQFLFLFAKQTNPNQSNRRSMVQWYSPL